MVIARLLTGGAQFLVLVSFHKAQTDHADADQRRGNQLRAGQLTDTAEDQAHDGDQSTGGIADGRGDGQLYVTQPDVADGHGQDVQQGYRQVGPNDGPGDFHAADKDLIRGVQAHDNTHGDDHFQMAVLVVCVLTADLGEEITAAPADERNKGKPKPHTSILLTN